MGGATWWLTGTRDPSPSPRSFRLCERNLGRGPTVAKISPRPGKEPVEPTCASPPYVSPEQTPPSPAAATSRRRLEIQWISGDAFDGVRVQSQGSTCPSAIRSPFRGFPQNSGFASGPSQRHRPRHAKTWCPEGALPGYRASWAWARGGGRGTVRGAGQIQSGGRSHCCCLLFFLGAFFPGRVGCPLFAVATGSRPSGGHARERQWEPQRVRDPQGF